MKKFIKRINEMIRKIAFIFIVCATCIACEQQKGGLTPVELQCEYQTEPTGIDVPEPRFSWQLLDPRHVRGQSQTAFHIMVASSPKRLATDKADVWNSGKITSPQSVLTPFEGEKLRSSAAYFWKVRVYDKDGNPSAWSKPARFITGILDTAEWDAAAWIRHPDSPRTKHIWFRKNIRLDAGPESAFIHVASLGHHELYVNGKKADDRVLAPALTNFDKRLFYVTYDLSKLLAKGDNTIGIWFASGWAIYYCFSKTPALRVRLDGKDAAGKTIAAISDTSWRCAESNSEDTRPTRIHNDNGGETVNALTFVPDWNSPAFDDSRWKHAATTADNDDIQLAAHDIVPSRIIETITAQKITDAGDGVYKIDFGKNFTGWLHITFRKLSAGDTVVIGSADDERDFDDFNIRNYFISSGKDGETFTNRFNYIAGRYANIKGLRQAPAPEDVVAYAVSTDLRRTGKFTSSNKLFNKIFETDLWTFLANTTEGYTSDCPHRERCGYGEVATITSWGIGLPAYDAGAFYRNVIRNWRDVQTPDGWGRNTAPQPNDVHWGGAMWSSAGMNVAAEHYRHYGDTQIIRLIYPTAVRWLEFLHNHTDKDSLLTKYRPHPGQFLGDWLAPGSRNEFGESEQAQYFNNCVYAMNLETFVEMAHLLNRPEDAALYGNRLAELRPAIHDRFYNPQTGLYSDGTQVQQAFALMTNVAPDSERQKVAATITDDMRGKHPYFDMGSSGLPVLLPYLTEHPETAELTASILNRTEFPGYGYFIDQGETTWPEDWKIDVPSKIHTCYTGIAGWFIKGLCGIQPDRNNAGYKHFIIKPSIVPETDFAEATTVSPYGEIVSRWEMKNNRFTLSVTAPPSTSATVYIPAAVATGITENGSAPENAEGVTVKERNSKYLVLEIKSGKYQFIGK